MASCAELENEFSKNAPISKKATLFVLNAYINQSKWYGSIYHELTVPKGHTMMGFHIHRSNFTIVLHFPSTPDIICTKKSVKVSKYRYQEMKIVEYKENFCKFVY